MRLVVALLLLPGLLLETKALLERVVELRIGVAEFLATHETFEALTEARTRAMPLGEGGHDLRMANWENWRCVSMNGKDQKDEYTNKRWRYAKWLNELPNELGGRCQDKFIST